MTAEINIIARVQRVKNHARVRGNAITVTSRDTAVYALITADFMIISFPAEKHRDCFPLTKILEKSSSNLTIQPSKLTLRSIMDGIRVFQKLKLHTPLLHTDSEL